MAPMRRQDTDMLARIDANVEALLKRDDDKEKRLRALERTQWWHRGAFAVVGAFLIKLGLPVTMWR